MSTKTFKVGEYGYAPFYKLTVNKDTVRVQALDKFKAEAGYSGVFKAGVLVQFEDAMAEQTTSYHAGQMAEWVKSKIST